MLSMWKRHFLGLDAMIINRRGVSVLCPVCCRALLLDSDDVGCPHCGSRVRVSIVCREAMEDYL